MRATSRQVQSTYIWLTLGNTLAASLIWGINTLFLLDAGLSNLEAFAANAFFTAGMMIFEVPTGIVADTWGRRTSYLLGTITLAVSTGLYLGLWQWSAPFWAWAAVSMLLGLGFTFFSGAVEAWLVDALHFTGFKDELESVFSKGQVASGAAMLVGSVAGGVIAQYSNLGVPFIIRAAILVVMFGVAWRLMKDWGFTPRPHRRTGVAVKELLAASIDNGLRRPGVRWIMLAAPFGAGVGIYAFYAMQPFLLELYGDKTAYWVAGLAAAIVAGAQILGGLAAPILRSLVHRRTSALIVGLLMSAATLGLIGMVSSFWAALGLLVLWALAFAAVTPIRQAYLNGLIASDQRATVLSFDSLMGSAGGVAVQPILGRAADVWSYATSYMLGAVIELLALPFLLLARRERLTADMQTAPHAKSELLKSGVLPHLHKKPRAHHRPVRK